MKHQNGTAGYGGGQVILTVGYGFRPVEQVLALLHGYGVEYVVDVRSRPYSGFRPEFSRETLSQMLRADGIGYVYMGDTLGGQPDDPCCYTDGKVNYRTCREQSWFQEGLARLRTAWDKNVRVALMCSEAKPELCHRSKLIGQALIEHGIAVQHIDEDGAPITQDDVVRTESARFFVRPTEHHRRTLLARPGRMPR